MSVFDNSLGLYIHIPFCDGKCHYCDFFSFKADESELDSYTEILINRIKEWSCKITDKTVDTVYFGGGTPSVLGTGRLMLILKNIFNSFKIAPSCEITIEANPSSAQAIDFSELKFAGVNRVSLGMQSAIPSELKLLGRRHSKEDVINTVGSIKSSGIDNISLDVMLGIPEQTADSLIETLNFCIALDVVHISTYLLTVEPDTVFGKNSGKYTFADDDLQAELYTLTSEYLKSKGFDHYEISNFCKNGLYSRHNIRYWQLKDYLGLGPSAHSLIGKNRFYYPRSIEAFKNNEIVDDGVGKTEEEYIMLMLRTKQGVNINEFENLFGTKPDKHFFNKVKLYESHGYIENDGNSVRLTEKGFLLSNTVIADLI